MISGSIPVRTTNFFRTWIPCAAAYMISTCTYDESPNSSARDLRFSSHSGEPICKFSHSFSSSLSFLFRSEVVKFTECSLIQLIESIVLYIFPDIVFNVPSSLVTAQGVYCLVA